MNDENTAKLNYLLPKLGLPEDYADLQGEKAFNFSRPFDAGEEIGCISDGLAALSQIEHEIARIDSRVDYLQRMESWDQERIFKTCAALKHRLRYKKLIQSRLGYLRRLEKEEAAIKHQQLMAKERSDPNAQQAKVLRQRRMMAVDQQFIRAAEEQLDRKDFDEMMEEAKERAFELAEGDLPA